MWDWLKNLFGKKKEAPPVVAIEPTSPIQGTVETKPDETPAKPLPPVPADRPINPGYKKAKEYNGKNESDSVFVKFMAGFWYLVGLASFKTIRGRDFAWCGLFVAVTMYQSGMTWQKDGAGAKNWRKYGIEYDYKTKGLPKSAIVWVDHDGDCSGGGNHVTYADGDCAPQDIFEMTEVSPGVWKHKSAVPKLIKGGLWPGYGGNQNDTVKRSMYHNYEICAVRWPDKSANGSPVPPPPPPVTKSIGCSGNGNTGESTR